MLALGPQGTGTAAVMLVIVLLANGMLQNILQPVAFGATLGLNPLAVLIVTIAAGSLFGMIGLILGAPLTSAAVHIARDVAAARAERQAEASVGRPSPPRPPEQGFTAAKHLPSHVFVPTVWAELTGPGV